jgi:hypothetical protein
MGAEIFVCIILQWWKTKPITSCKHDAGWSDDWLHLSIALAELIQYIDHKMLIGAKHEK